MMKQVYFKILCLCLFLISTGTISAQDCSASFTVSTTSTPSTCQANGTITVTLNGDLTNIYNVQYALSSVGGFSINPQNNNVLNNIPAGTYTVSVRAFCKISTEYDVVKTVANVTVGGTYKVPSVSFNANTSRKSYDICNTGIIALNVTDGSGAFTFNITSAPAGVTTGIVVPAKVGTVYTLPGQTYPAGDYVVQIQDGCYTSIATFTLGQVTGFPAYSSTGTNGFRPTFIDNSCSSVYWYAGPVSNSNADYYRYYQDGMYEVGAAPVRTMPTAWTPWTQASLISSYNLLLNIAPYNISNFYATNSISIYTRLKGCPTNYSTTTTNIKTPSSNSAIGDRNCTNYIYNVKPWYDYDAVVCYPLSIVVTKVSDGSVVFTNPSWSYNANGQPVTLDYDVNYRATMTDPNGTVITTTINTSRNPTFTTNLNTCSNYQLQYLIPSGNTCWPVNIVITDGSGNVVCTDVVTSYTGYRTSCPLDYGKPYTFTATYTTSGYVYTTIFNSASTLPTTVSLTRGYSNNCIEDNGYFFTSVASNTPWPVGTTFSITGPAGYTTQTYTSTASTWYYYWPTSTLPAGTYTLTTNFGCGTPIVTTIVQSGVYSGKALDYTTENTCSGMKVTPTGLMTFQGFATTTYYRLTSGPAAGYDKSVISPGGSFTFSTPGTYVIGILNTNDAGACVINTKTFVYTAPPSTLSKTATGAYECVDNTTGVILLQAVDGVAPYTYQLWNKDNTVRLVAEDIVSSGQVHFNYGDADSTYTVRVKDNCGNGFSQTVTLAKLSTARIVYGNPASVCSGDTIFLKCITLGNTVYKWTGPNGYTSNSQNPIILNGQVNMSGWYKVSVMPEFCGAAVEDSAYITVYPPLAAGAVAAPQAICVRTAANALNGAVTGGSGTYIYQWQSSANGTTGWANISGATTATYLPPVKTQSGASYYRIVVTDRCGLVNGNVITVNSTPCYIPVNPNIRAKRNQL